MQQLTLTLPFRLPHHQLPAFRSAIIELTQRAEALFHNHPTDTAPHGSWDYPLIRYTLIRGHAAVTGIGTGAELLTSCLLPQLLKNSSLTIRGINYATTGFRLSNRSFQLELSDEPFPLGVHRWVALNKENYQKWKGMDGQEAARKELLGNALTGHLRVIANQLTPEYASSDITANILRVDQVKKIRWQKADLIGFTVIAESRLRLPDGMGVGRLVAYGYGETMSPRIYKSALGIRKSKNCSPIMEKRS